MRRLLWTAAGVSTSLGAATLAIGLLHLPAARPLLRWLAPSVCPVGGDLDPVAQDAVRAQTLATVRGTEPAKARPALGFELEVTRREQVLAWADLYGVTCTERGLGLSCEQVPGVAIGRGSTVPSLTLGFDGQDRLVDLAASWPDLPPEHALTWLQAGVNELDAQVGPPSKGSLPDSPEWLVEAPLRRSAVEYRYRDFRATVSATHMGGGRVSTRATWQAVPAT